MTTTQTGDRTFRALAPLVAGFLLLFSIAGGAIWLSTQQQNLVARVRQTLEVENQLRRVQTLIINAETGQRGFLLTGRDVYLKPYDTAKGLLSAQIDVLNKQTADNPAQQSAIAALRPIIASKLAEIDSTIILRTNNRFEEALAIVNTDTGSDLMTRIRETLMTMRAEEERLLQNRSARAEQINTIVEAALIASALLVVLIAYLTLRDGHRRLRELQSSNTRLATEVTERAAAEGQVRQLQKMEAIGQLTGGIAHDFNNMMAIVIGSLEMAKRRLTGSEHPKITTSLNNAMEGAQRAATLTARLLAFSRQQALAPKPVDPNKLVGGMSELLQRTIGEAIRIETVLAGGLWRICTDAAQMENALVNLAVNARDAMGDGGRLTIETANTDLDERYARAHNEVKAGQYVMISVSDTGTGMTPDVIERAFDPFFTTKSVGKGTGLGLSQVFGFVKQSGGHVKIYSETGHGTTIKIYLPRHAGNEAALADANTKTSPLPVGALNEIVLVVEDETAVRHTSVDTLRDLGYTVIHAANPSEALQTLSNQPSTTLLFTDIVMPDMNGRQLADKALEMNPMLKVLYTSGYTRNAVVHNGIVDPGTALLPKPFTTAQLATKVRETLDG